MSQGLHAFGGMDEGEDTKLGKEKEKRKSGRHRQRNRLMERKNVYRDTGMIQHIRFMYL